MLQIILPDNVFVFIKQVLQVLFNLGRILRLEMIGIDDMIAEKGVINLVNRDCDLGSVLSLTAVIMPSTIAARRIPATLRLMML